MTRSTVVRTTALVTHFIFILAILLITLFLATNIPSLFIHGISGLLALIYVPATVVLNAKKRKTRWDRARREVIYLGLQGVIWLAGAIVAGISGGPSACNARLYQSGLNQYKYSINDRLAATQYCDTMSAVIAVSCLHSAAMGLWIWWLVRVLRRLSLEKSESEGDLWKVSTGEIMRRDISDQHHTRRTRTGETDGTTHGGGAVTPFVHHTSRTEAEAESGQSQDGGRQMSERAVSVSPTTITRQRTAESEVVIADPEVDHGPYVPPPPYQSHYTTNPITGLTTIVGAGPAQAPGPDASTSIPTPGSSTTNPNTYPISLSTSPSISRRPLPSTPTSPPNQLRPLGNIVTAANPGLMAADTLTTSPLATMSNQNQIPPIPENQTGPVNRASMEDQTGESTYNPTWTTATGSEGETVNFDHDLGTATVTGTETGAGTEPGMGPWIGDNTTLQRVLAEKEESKDVIRRALER